MKHLVQFNRPNGKPVLVAPEHVSMVEPSLEGSGSRIWLIGWNLPVIVDEHPTEVWSRLWHSDRTRPEGG